MDLPGGILDGAGRGWPAPSTTCSCITCCRHDVSLVSARSRLLQNAQCAFLVGALTSLSVVLQSGAPGSSSSSSISTRVATLLCCALLPCCGLCPMLGRLPWKQPVNSSLRLLPARPAHGWLCCCCLLRLATWAAAATCLIGTCSRCSCSCRVVCLAARCLGNLWTVAWVAAFPTSPLLAALLLLAAARHLGSRSY